MALIPDLKFQWSTEECKEVSYILYSALHYALEATQGIPPESISTLKVFLDPSLANSSLRYFWTSSLTSEGVRSGTRRMENLPVDERVSSVVLSSAKGQTNRGRKRG